MDSHTINLSRFRNPDVVAEYEGKDGLRDCELFLYEKYICNGDDVLDLGVGAGRTTGFLAGKARRYIGADYSEEMIAASRKRFPEQEFLVLDGADMRMLSSTSFDVIVFSFNGLSYLYPDKQRLACVQECHRLLRAGGTFIFSLPNPSSIFIRPSRAGRTPLQTLEGVVRSIGANLFRMAQRLTMRPFWTGRGYALLHAHGGLNTYMAIPVRVLEEVGAFGFSEVATYPEDYPRRGSRFVSRWYYYVFRKTQD
ncbi:MAG: class I SAM-dependent methyltransferase [Proteobacteria bacterium]|nr:class I SAM-dependent methyltransferase [Pseudomonadota bacterium]